LTSGPAAIADAIKDMRAISTVIVNTFPLPIQDIKSKAELDFSGKELEVEDMIIIAALIPSNVSHIEYINYFLNRVVTDIPVYCDKGGMTSLSLASNGLGVEGATSIAAVLPKCT
jgi:hypothetical protein